MADRYATKDGDWSDVSVWDGGVSLPGAADTVRPNGFDVVIDQDITVAILTNNASGAAAANGTFTLSDGITVNADLDGRAAPNADFVICSAGDQFVIGNVTAFVGSGWVLRKTTSGLLSITGDLTCAASNTSHAVYLQNNASLSVVGDLGNDGLSVNGNSSSVYSTSSGDISVTGDVIGARANIFAVRPGLYSTGTGNITVTGTVRGGAQGAYSYGVYCTQAVTVVHNGDAIADAVPAIALTSTSSIYVHNGNAQSASNGKQALDVRGYYLISSALSTTHAYRTNNSGVAGDERTLYTLNALPESYTPAEADVRSGTSYNNGESTGTLIVPPVESVGVGVPVDDTVGTAVTRVDFEFVGSRFVAKGSVDQSVFVRVFDDNGFVSGLSASDVSLSVRRFSGGRLVGESSLTPVELSSVGDVHVDGGFVEDVDRRRYRVDLSDAAVVAGSDLADRVDVVVGASGVSYCVSEEVFLSDNLPWVPVISDGQIADILDGGKVDTDAVVSAVGRFLGSAVIQPTRTVLGPCEQTVNQKFRVK